MDTKIELIAMSAHELKAPLALINAYSQLISTTSLININMQEGRFMEKISKQVGKMEMLIQQMLDAAQVGQEALIYNKSSQCFPTFLRSFYADMQLLAPQHELILVMDETLHFPVFIDRGRMEKVLINLLINATKYSAEGSKIIVSCSLTAAGVLLVSLKDEGVGIASAHLSLIFDKFYRVANTAYKCGGLGLGLYLANNIVKAHDSTLQVFSKEGQGTCFYFILKSD